MGKHRPHISSWNSVHFVDLCIGNLAKCCTAKWFYANTNNCTKVEELMYEGKSNLEKQICCGSFGQSNNNGL